MTFQEFMQQHYPTITPTPPDPVVNEIVPHGTDSTPHIEDCESLQDTSLNLLHDSHPDFEIISRDSFLPYQWTSEEDIF